MLEHIRLKYKNRPKRELGTAFEILIKDFLLADKHYKVRFTDVKLWHEWESREGADTGIDIVATERDGTLCAIQCKCYADDQTIELLDIATFLSTASEDEFTTKILFTTAGKISRNVLKKLEKGKCSIINSWNMDDTSVDWSKYPRIVPKKSFIPFDYQKTAIKKTVDGFAKMDRGKLIMACGTGKTLCALHIAENNNVAGIGRVVLYLVPSIPLIQQSMRSWSNNANITHRYIAVCSDKSVSDGGSITELECPATTDSETIRGFLEKTDQKSLTVIFSTYQSITKIQTALENLDKKRLDLTICDEAHRTTGVESDSYFTVIHDDQKIGCTNRLYMTATPRVYKTTEEKTDGKNFYSMDSETYGPTFHELTFRQAVDMKALSNFKVKIAMLPEDVMPKKTQIDSARDLDMLVPISKRARAISMWHGIQYPDYDGLGDLIPNLLQRVIVFFNSIEASQTFAGRDKPITKIRVKNTENKKRKIQDKRWEKFADVIDKYHEQIGSKQFLAKVRHIY